MKKITKTTKIYISLAAVALIAGLVIGIFLIGDRAISDGSGGNSSRAKCEMTADQRAEIDKLFNPNDVMSDVVLPLAPRPDDVEIQKLLGECEYDALIKAHQLGGRTLRDLSDCGEGCLITDDLRFNRINYRQKAGVIIDIGAY